MVAVGDVTGTACDRWSSSVWHHDVRRVVRSSK